MNKGSVVERLCSDLIAKNHDINGPTLLLLYFSCLVTINKQFINQNYAYRKNFGSSRYVFPDQIMLTSKINAKICQNYKKYKNKYHKQFSPKSIVLLQF